MIDKQKCLQLAHELIEIIEVDDDEQIKLVLDDLMKLHETELFGELGKLTRDLHDALSGFQIDSGFSNLAEKEIPDAKERLNYVITMTDDAAHKTLSAIEACFPVADDIENHAKELGGKWEKFRKRDMNVEEFRAMSADLENFLASTSKSTALMNSKLNEVLMAQGFQDLSGQIIRKVIKLVQDVEDNMVEIIRIAGKGMTPSDDSTTQEQQKIEKSELSGPAIPGMEEATIVSGQDEVDDLLSSLGF
ncbi:MAG: protein phosphatase CheZ [Methylococcales bacterium]|jgi:chemotaxis protein CheZ|nr:protein phosphatase CheZ [Methylococcales bacterium]